MLFLYKSLLLKYSKVSLSKNFNILYILRSKHLNIQPYFVRHISLYISGKEVREELNKSAAFRMISTFSNFLIILNSSVNFFIYLMKDPK